MALPFRFLLAGLDTVECAYFLDTAFGCRLDFGRLLAEKEALRQAKSREPKAVTLGHVEFLLQPYGSSSGYPLVLSNEDWIVACGEFNNPSFFVKFKSLALWRDGADTLHRRFLEWAAGVGLSPFRPESLARVDFAFDYGLPRIDFDENSFVSLSSKDTQYRKDGQIQTFVLGKGDVVLRVYDKVAEIAEQSGKSWFFDLWGEKENVWRIEWQVRKPVLRRFGLRTFEDLAEGAGDLLRYLGHEHDTLRVPMPDSNRSRWPLHPLWRDLQAQTAAFSAQGVYREIDPGALLDERLLRIAISMYGYLKRIAAIRTLQAGLPDVSPEQALGQFERLLDKVHDPLTWRGDVAKRVDLMRLGQW